MLDRHLRYVAVSRSWYTSYRIEAANIEGKPQGEVLPRCP